LQFKKKHFITLSVITLIKKTANAPTTTTTTEIIHNPVQWGRGQITPIKPILTDTNIPTEQDQSRINTKAIPID